MHADMHAEMLNERLIAALQSRPAAAAVEVEHAQPAAKSLSFCDDCKWTHDPECSTFTRGKQKIVFKGMAKRMALEIHKALENGKPEMPVQDLLEACKTKRLPSKVFHDGTVEGNYHLLFRTGGKNGGGEKWLIGYKL